jgi:hypothetical protein
MPKSVHSKERASSLPSAAAMIESIIRGASQDDGGLQYAVAAAGPDLRKLVHAGIGELHVHDHAAALARRIEGAAYKKNEASVSGVEGDVDDAVYALRMADASAAFVLGLLVGQQLAGGAR